jgi:hypothetical protein
MFIESIESGVVMGLENGWAAAPDGSSRLSTTVATLPAAPLGELVSVTSSSLDFLLNATITPLRRKEMFFCSVIYPEYRKFTFIASQLLSPEQKLFWCETMDEESLSLAFNRSSRQPQHTDNVHDVQSHPQFLVGTPPPGHQVKRVA